MMRNEKLISFVYYICALLLGGIFGLVLSNAAHAADVPETRSVSVYTDQQHPVENTGDAQVYYVDQAQQIGDELLKTIDAVNVDWSKLVDADGELTQAGRDQKDKAVQEIRARLYDSKEQLSEEGMEFQEKTNRAGLIAFRAKLMGLKSYPAVVLNNEYAIYGVADVQKALALLIDDIKNNNVGGQTQHINANPNSLPALGNPSRKTSALNNNANLAAVFSESVRAGAQAFNKIMGGGKGNKGCGGNGYIAMQGSSIPIATKESIDTTEIVQSSMNFSCVEYRFVGTCIWFTCNIGCWFSFSPKFAHFNPDLVVSAYAETGTNPWTAVESYSKETSAFGGIGVLNTPNDYKRVSDLTYKNVDAIGHPGDLSELMGDSVLCRRATQPYVPYYLSTLDGLFWRFSVTEMFYPQTWIPGLNEIGWLMANNWGSTYPRHGFLEQQDDRKAGAVIAHRAASIVYDIPSPHLKTAATRISAYGSGWWPPGMMIENDITNHKWQRLLPSASSGCEVFGGNAQPPVSGVDDMGFPVAEGRGYVYALWRPYSCCQKIGDDLIFNPPSGHNSGAF